LYRFLEHELDIERSEVTIERAQNGIGSQKRRIIVRCLDYSDTDLVLQSADKLKGSVLGVVRDYPQKSVQSWKELYQSDDAKRAREKRLKTQIKYPARLHMQYRLVEDKLPDWFSVLNESRVDNHSYKRTLPEATKIQFCQSDIDESVQNSVFTVPIVGHVPCIR